jgi:hypothetical protein
VFTARYALSPYIKQIRFVFKGSLFTFATRFSTGRATQGVSAHVKGAVLAEADAAANKRVTNILACNTLISPLSTFPAAAREVAL